MKPPVESAAWSNEVKALHRHDMQEIWDRTIAPQVWNQYHNQLDVYLEIAGVTPRRILDVGCAQGTLALLLAERGHGVTAVDLRPEFIAYAQSRWTRGTVRFVAANAADDDIPGQYDLVFANQIVEHMVYPERLLTRLHDALVPGGTLVVTTPNADYVKSSLPTFRELGERSRWEHMQYTADADGHFFAYTREELIEVVRAAGFSHVQSRFFETPFVSGHMKVRHLHRVVPAPILRSLDRAMLAIPWLGPKLSHQLLVTGTR